MKLRLMILTLVLFLSVGLAQTDFNKLIDSTKAQVESAADEVKEAYKNVELRLTALNSELIFAKLEMMPLSSKRREELLRREFAFNTSAIEFSQATVKFNLSAASFAQANEDALNGLLKSGQFDTPEGRSLAQKSHELRPWLKKLRESVPRTDLQNWNDAISAVENATGATLEKIGPKKQQNK